MTPQTILEIEQAIHLLRQTQVIATPTDALDYLQERLAQYRLLSLYQQFFPEEFAHSLASPYTLNTGEYSPLAWEFLQRVSDHFFPLPYLDFEEL